MENLINYKNKGVCIKYAKENSVSLEYAELLLEETKKFLYCCSISKNALSPALEIDLMWHQFILFTKDYRNFCYNILGKFIDHHPDVEISNLTRQQNNTQLELARKLALQNFGNINSKVWYKSTSKTLSGDCSDSPSCGGCTDAGGTCHGCSTE